MNNLKAKAKVTLTIEVSTSGIWGQDCSMTQILKQSKEEAINMISYITQRGVLIKSIDDVAITIHECIE